MLTYHFKGVEGLGAENFIAEDVVGLTDSLTLYDRFEVRKMHLAGLDLRSNHTRFLSWELFIRFWGIRTVPGQCNDNFRNALTAALDNLQDRLIEAGWIIQGEEK